MVTIEYARAVFLINAASNCGQIQMHDIEIVTDIQYLQGHIYRY